MSSEDALLIVDPCHRVDAAAMAERLRAYRLRPLFARSRVEAGHLIARGKATAYVLVPPMVQGDAFALLHRFRRARPAIPGAVVLGAARAMVGGTPRVVWNHSEAVVEPLRRAVLVVATLVGDAEDTEWDAVTGDIDAASPVRVHSVAALLDESVRI